MDLNTYEGIAEYYDVLMTNGYYDYNEIAQALHQVLRPRKRVLELGVGTGLLAEALLKQDGTYDITGVDNTDAMLIQAKERLGNRIRYASQDVTRMDLGTTFEAAFSVGGCWYFIDHGPEKDLELCSHIDDSVASIKGLAHVTSHIEPGGLLSFALQGAHADYSKPLDNGLVYRQSIKPETFGFTKSYRFEQEGKVVAAQDYSYLVKPLERMHQILEGLGCEPVGLDAARKFFTYQKR